MSLDVLLAVSLSGNASSLKDRECAHMSRTVKAKVTPDGALRNTRIGVVHPTHVAKTQYLVWVSYFATKGPRGILIYTTSTFFSEEHTASPACVSLLWPFHHWL
jgi:hypothetical protein